MARSSGGDEIWGTWEELLLACAVGRHGTADWGSVAAAVGERTTFPHLLTAEGCERRYRDLCRRFKCEPEEIGGASPGGGDRDGDGDGDGFAVPWLEELRRLRVAELRREVQRYDVSIVSLQLKVKKLKEERSLREDGGAGEDAGGQEEERGKSNGRLPEPDAGGGGEGSGRSCNESNSPEPKEDGQTRKTGEDPAGEEDGPSPSSAPEPGDVAPVAAGDDKAPGEGSCNGSSETVVMGKGAAEAVTAADDARESSMPLPPDSGESMAESTGEDAAKESSDVQSSASPSRRRKPRGGRRKPPPATVSGGNSEGDSPEAKVDLSSKSQPLVFLLEIIRSSKYGSVFERRLEIQESAPYRSLVRQHMDLETVGKKVEEGAYTPTELFRDLFLICANAAIFFPKDSSEHAAAVHLRKLIGSKFASLNLKPAPQASPEAPAQSMPSQLPAATAQLPLRLPPPPRQPAVVKPKSEPEAHTLLLEKVAPAPPLGVCRKRSSLSAKAASAAVKAAKEEVTAATAAEVLSPVLADEKPELAMELENADKKVAKEKPVARGLRTKKNRGPTKKPSLPGGPDSATPSKQDEKENSVAEPVKAPVEKRVVATAASSDGMSTPTVVSVPKKRSATNFLNRLREGGPSGSPSPGSDKAKAVKNVESNVSRGGGEHKRGVREDRKKEKRDSSGPAKRNVGRPPKRPAPTPPPSQPPAKRVREADVPANKKRGGRR